MRVRYAIFFYISSCGHGRRRQVERQAERERARATHGEPQTNETPKPTDGLRWLRPSVVAVIEILSLERCNKKNVDLSEC